MCCERIAVVRSFLDNTCLAADAPLGVSHGAQAIGTGAIRSAISSDEAAGSPLSPRGIPARAHCSSRCREGRSSAPRQ